MSHFDVKEQKSDLLCKQCHRITPHTRYDNIALWTCRHPSHVHPRKRETSPLNGSHERQIILPNEYGYEGDVGETF